MDVTPILRRLAEAHPDAACALTHENPFQLLVATILSAQCTDARVNMVTPALFAKYPDALAMSRAPQADLERLIRTTGFFRNKSKSIRGASERLIEAFGGVVPRTMDELLSLPGVARKTANVVLGVGHGVADGVVVDTHVERVSRRLGLSRGKNPVEIEQELMKRIPREQWIAFSHLMIFHGRRICVARKPRCEACTLFELCPSGPYYIKGRVPPWDRRAAETKPVRAATPARAAKKRKAAAAKKAKVAAAKKTAARPVRAVRAAKKKAAPRRRSA
jgi:endonuclease III